MRYIHISGGRDRVKRARRETRHCDTRWEKERERERRSFLPAVETLRESPAVGSSGTLSLIDNNIPSANKSPNNSHYSRDETWLYRIYTRRVIDANSYTAVV